MIEAAMNDFSHDSIGEVVGDVMGPAIVILTPRRHAVRNGDPQQRERSVFGS